MFEISRQFTETYPDAHIGLLVMRNVENVPSHPALEENKRGVESALRDRFAGMEPGNLDSVHPMSVYAAYYKRFDKTYHVTGQLKSIVFKDKSIPSVASLVEAMFIAELKNGLLTAGHDLDQATLPLTANVATGNETYTLMRGAEQVLKPNDMYIADARGILSSIIYGPDQRTQIQPSTKNVVFTVYAPAGVKPDELETHLQDIRDLVRLVTPQAKVELLQVFGENS
mgnify:CR=1 FL=1